MINLTSEQEKELAKITKWGEKWNKKQRDKAQKEKKK